MNTVAASQAPTIPREAADRHRGFRLLDRVDALAIVALIVGGMTPRLVWRSGWGLGDDVLYRHFVNTILTNHVVPADNTSYRVTWWLPTALACRALGLSEVGMILPITLIDAAAIGLLYAFGKALWGRLGGVIAAALMIVCPLDFAWSTTLASDLCVSFCSAATFVCILRATVQSDAERSRALWRTAALCLLLAYHSKVSAVLLFPAVAFTCWRRRHQLGRPFLAFLTTGAVLFGLSAIVSYVFAGDTFAPYHSEISFQGLQGEIAVQWHRLTAPVFWSYLDWLFWPNAYGNFFYSIYPHLLVLCVVVGSLIGLRSSLDVMVWLLVVFLGMQFNLQYVSGVWVTGFRNVRHIHVLVYPIVLMLTGYFVHAIRRWPRPSLAVLLAVLVFGAWQSVSTATKTHIAFADRRRAVQFLLTQPAKTVYSDFQIQTWASVVSWQLPFKELEGFDRTKRRQQIAAVESGYLVTGGGREPYYGCIDCIPRAEEVDGRWRLLREFPGPTEPLAWRPEPLRVWEVGP